MTVIIEQVLARVQNLSKFQRVVTSDADSGGQGSGHIMVHNAGEHHYYVQEIGSFRLNNGAHIRVFNEWLWCFFEERIEISHTRYGRAQPVNLVTLVPNVTGKYLETLNPHQCNKDYYQATAMLLATQGIRLCWSIKGSKKAITITHEYH